MGFREWFNKHPKVMYGALGVCLVLAIGMVVSQVLANRKVYPSQPPDSYYTVDDGKTFFVASSALYPPFDHAGQQAVHAFVFRDSKGKKFVGLLERYSVASKKLLDAGKPVTAEMMRFGREIKRPGDAAWIKTGDMKVEGKMSNVVAPNGETNVEAVEP